MGAQQGVSLNTLAAHVGGEVLGNGEICIHQVATLATAQAGDISFLHNPKYRRQLSETRASAVILAPQVAETLGEGGTFACIVVPNPYVAYARIASLLNPVPTVAAGIHPTAQVADGASVDPTASIGPGVVLATGVVVGPRSVIHAHCVLGSGSTVGADCLIYPRVTVYADCQVGSRVIIHSGAVIGADGFGFAPSRDGWVKIPQIAGVVIGDDVEIGANTSIDRGALTPTIIGRGCKLDNQIQIGHNCEIGEHTVIAGCVGIAGSTKVGSWCAIGGAAMILGHLQIADRCEISPGTMVMKSITQSGKYTALMPLETHEKWLANASQLRHLQSLAQRIAALEKQLKTHNNE